jgi:hypothetical protein
MNRKTFFLLTDNSEKIRMQLFVAQIELPYTGSSQIHIALQESFSFIIPLKTEIFTIA